MLANIQRPFCTVTSGDGTSVGDEITCGTESFYVVKNDGTTVKLLSKYNLNVGDTTYASGTIGIQNEKVIGYKSGKTLYGPVAFSGSDYWLSDSVLKSEYSSYYVYDSNSNLYQYVESYKKYLINSGMNILEARLLSEDEAIELGCSGTSCTKAPSWLYSTNYWLGTLYSGDDQNIRRINASGNFGSFEYTTDNRSGVRPLIIIPASELKLKESLTSYTQHGVSLLESNINLPSEYSSVVFKVEITNIGNTEMGILEINNLPENLDYDIINYDLKDKICDSNNVCKLGITKEIYVRIKYKENGYDSSNTNYNLKVGFNFQPFYYVKYTDIVDEVFPSEVIGRDTLKVNFGFNHPSYLNIKIKGAQIYNYTYENGILTIYGDVEIIKPADSIEIGDYVKYNLAYMDIYSDYEFSASDGWRVLSKGTRNEDGTYNGLKLLSTGIPAILNYGSGSVAVWWDDDTTLAKNVRAANGMKNPDKFKLIEFKYKASGTSVTTTNVARFRKVGEYTGTDVILPEDAFYADGATAAYIIILEEVNAARGFDSKDTTSVADYDAAPGLFHIEALGKFNYTTSTNPPYWLSNANESSTSNVRRIQQDGDIEGSGNEGLGVRVVICLPDNFVPVRTANNN